MLSLIGGCIIFAVIDLKTLGVDDNVSTPESSRSYRSLNSGNGSTGRLYEDHSALINQATRELERLKMTNYSIDEVLEQRENHRVPVTREDNPNQSVAFAFSFGDTAATTARTEEATPINEPVVCNRLTG